MHALKTTLAMMAGLAALFTLGAAQSVPFYTPTASGGSMLLDAQDGYGEPLNVIISGESSAAVLTDDGIVNYARAIGFSTECAGIHIGAAFTANLGDGNGPVAQTIELRQDYDNPIAGTCWESLVGGNHFRVFRQNGPSANSGALFLAVSMEESATNNHNIQPDGYDTGRNNLVAGAVGSTSFGGVSYNTQAQDITGLLASGSNGINHGISQDGVVALLTVTIV